MTINELIEKHPKIFHGEVPSLGIAVGPGWIPLLDELCTEIEGRLAADDDLFRVHQIKEKFAAMRFYYKHPERVEKLDAVVNAACARASTICEECGAPGEIVEKKGGWFAALCETHAEPKQEK